MTEERLNSITYFMRQNVWRNPDLMFAMNTLMLKMNTDDVRDIDKAFWKLLDIATSLHNELYKEVTGEYYDYAFHWTNKIGACDPEDDLFKNIEE